MHFVEIAAGRYLNIINEGRPAWGTAWEMETQRRDAGRRTEEETVETSRLIRQANSASTLVELLSILPEGSNVPMSPRRFVELYRTLPQVLRTEIINENELAQLLWSETWQRTTLWKKGGKWEVYLIDNKNNITQTLIINASLIEFAQTAGQVQKRAIDTYPHFTGRIYSGEFFMKIFRSLSQDERMRLFTDPDIILAIPTAMTRMGFAPPIDDNADFGWIAFESSDGVDRFTQLFPLSTEAYNRFMYLMVTQDSDTLFVNPILDDYQ